MVVENERWEQGESEEGWTLNSCWQVLFEQAEFVWVWNDLAEISFAVHGPHFGNMELLDVFLCN